MTTLAAHLLSSPIPFLVVALRVAGLTHQPPSSGFWGWDGWSAIEAIGTVLAVSAAVGLAAYGWYVERRRSNQQRRTVRLLLRQEVAMNQGELSKESRRIEAWSAALVQAAQGVDPEERTLMSKLHPSEWPPAPGDTAHGFVLAQLHTQLEFYSLSLDAGDVELLGAYYDMLRNYYELYEHPRKPGEYANISEFVQWVTELRSALSRAESTGNTLLEVLQRR